MYTRMCSFSTSKIEVPQIRLGIFSDKHERNFSLAVWRTTDVLIRTYQIHEQNRLGQRTGKQLRELFDTPMYNQPKIMFPYNDILHYVSLGLSESIFDRMICFSSRIKLEMGRKMYSSGGELPSSNRKMCGFALVKNHFSHVCHRYETILCDMFVMWYSCDSVSFPFYMHKLTVIL